MLTKTSVHAVRAVIALAQLPKGEFAGATRLAEQIGAPPNYLSKLLQQLARGGLLHSQKGSSGGFALARKPADISLFDIVEPLEQIARWDGCILGRPECGGANPCALHHRFGDIRNQYLNLLQSTSIDSLIAEIPVS